MVSVIIPNYNHARFLHQRIDSVLGQVYNDIEVIILDDCSTDNSREVIEVYRSHPKVAHIIYNEQNSGSSFKQWKKGLEFVKGEWVWIAESDDACSQHFLNTLLDNGIGDESCFRFCVSLPIDENNKELEAEVYSIRPGLWGGIDFFKQHLIELNRVPNASAVVIKKSLLAQVLDDDVFSFKLAGDWLVWCRASLNTKVYYTDAVKNFHRKHSQTVRDSVAKKGMFFSEFRSFRFCLAKSIQAISDQVVQAELLCRNKELNYKEEGLLGCEMIRNKRLLKSLPHIIRASLFPAFTTYYVRSAAYWFVKTYITPEGTRR